MPLNSGDCRNPSTGRAHVDTVHARGGDMSQMTREFDVIIIGAGISGVSAAYHLQKRCPGKSYAILEARDAIGGTWDLFKYPGIRSDSDMFTLGFGFRPWRGHKVIADGPAIKDYVSDTAEEYGIVKHIRFGRRVQSMSWSSAKSTWRIRVTHGDAEEIYETPFIMSCAGYYRYASGYTPDIPGMDAFSGDIIHPQQWSEDYDHTGKRIVVIGSGATAVTLVPSLAEKAAHVTMLQRSPSYYFAMPAVSGMSQFFAKFLPGNLAHSLMRWLRIMLQQVSFKFARAKPEKMAKNLILMTRDRLPEGYDVDTHFTPRYNPWDQRLCVVPDDDLFNAIKSGGASVVTDTIKSIKNDSIELQSGDVIDADVVVTATGLELEMFGGAEVVVDGDTVHPGDILTYKGVMFEKIPNLVSVFGYTNASWTLRADLVNAYACRLINYFDEHQYASATPVNDDPEMEREPFLDFSSGYVTRSAARLPKQGARAPWRHPQDYFRDVASLRFASLDDGVLRFTPAQHERADANVAASAQTA